MSNWKNETCARCEFFGTPKKRGKRVGLLGRCRFGPPTGLGNGSGIQPCFHGDHPACAQFALKKGCKGIITVLLDVEHAKLLKEWLGGTVDVGYRYEGATSDLWMQLDRALGKLKKAAE